MVDYAARNLDPLNLLASTEGIDTGTGDVPKAYVDQLTWAYLGGLRFITALRDLAGGWKLVDYALESRPPATTEQILHPRKYVRDELGGPVRIDGAPLRARGWQRADRSVFGELPTSQLLELGVDRPRARRAAAGWDGDRYELWRRDVPPADCEYPCRSDLVLVAKWGFDTTRDANQFTRTVPGYLERGLGATPAGTAPGGSTAGTSRSPAATGARRSSSPRTAASRARPRWRRSRADLRRSGREPLRKLLGAFWIFAGTMHFVRSREYEAIVPDYMPLSPSGRGALERLRRDRGRPHGAARGDPAAGPLVDPRRAGRRLPRERPHGGRPRPTSRPRACRPTRIPRWLLWARLAGPGAVRALGLARHRVAHGSSPPSRPPASPRYCPASWKRLSSSSTGSRAANARRPDASGALIAPACSASSIARITPARTAVSSSVASIPCSAANAWRVSSVASADGQRLAAHARARRPRRRAPRGRTAAATSSTPSGDVQARGAQGLATGVGS